MAGVDNIVAKPGHTVGEAVVDAAQGSQSVSTQTIMLLKSSQFNATSGGVLTQSVGNLNQSTEPIKTIVNIPQAASNQDSIVDKHFPVNLTDSVTARSGC